MSIKKKSKKNGRIFLNECDFFFLCVCVNHRLTIPTADTVYAACHNKFYEIFFPAAPERGHFSNFLLDLFIFFFFYGKLFDSMIGRTFILFFFLVKRRIKRASVSFFTFFFHTINSRYVCIHARSGERKDIFTAARVRSARSGERRAAVGRGETSQ